MAEPDYDAIDNEIDASVRGLGKSAIGTSRSPGDLVGANPAEIDILRSPCAMYLWLEANTPYTFQGQVNLNHSQGRVSIIIRRKSDNSVKKRIDKPINAGLDGSPDRVVPIIHRKMLRVLCARVWERLNA